MKCKNTKFGMMGRIGLLQSFNDEVNKSLDSYLNLLLLSNTITIVEISLIGYKMKIKFNNNKVIEFWNENKWYAWMTEGRIYTEGKNKHIEFEWRANRPKRRTMNLLLEKIENFMSKYEVCAIIR